MRNRAVAVGVMVVVLCCGVVVSSGQECKARVLAPVTDNMGNLWKVGDLLPVDIDRENGGSGSFCASGGSCVPRKVDGTVVLALLNCRIGPALGGGDYKLVADVSLSGSAAAARLHARQNAEEQLSKLGFSNASAGSLADDYVHRPNSRNGRLVARALTGSQAAISTLKRTNP